MKPSIKSTLAEFAMVVVAGCGTRASAVRFPRIELLTEVRVTGAKVSLSHLLPSDARSSVRALAESISFGAAPQPGNTRVLERQQLLAEIGGSREIAAEIAVPERVVVSRDTRPLTAEEVLVAILAEMERSGYSAGTHLSREDVLFQTQILVGPGDAGLEVLRSDFDAGIKCARFLLRASRDPRVLPFYVTARMAGDFDLAAFLVALGREPSNSRQKPPIPPRAAKPAILVTPGEPATLVLESKSLRMVADVIPLERGAMGQRVRVRALDTGKLLRARVDGRAHLDLDF